ncbi:hypothetical protein [Micromonospora sp. WMMD812]|uniref:hypothetical protein n=1 Tax=Micromonospora sp. WMMD812 TaxID=3015152 RepID=UPI00248D27CB|nr:hypothetical protein [Micromonospora sp. WMMD812]WBB67574.1 hypothetical protein O7603_31590 [Micromonospora sp. WMMD812]
MREALRSAIETDEPPVANGPARVFATAKRIRTRQRFVMFAAGVATLGLLAGAVNGVSLARAGGDQSGVPTPRVAIPSASPTPRASAGTSCPDCPDPAADKVLAALKELLPPGSAISAPYAQAGYAEVVITDRSGKTKVMVNVQPHFADRAKPGAENSAPLDIFNCQSRSSPRGSTCTAKTLPDGTRLVTTVGPERTGHDRIIQRTVDIFRPDGVRIAITAWNAVEPKTNTATRDEPLLTLTQLQGMATSPAWPT